MARVLVLNATYEPINVCTLRRAAVLLLKQKAELLEQQSSEQKRGCQDDDQAEAQSGAATEAGGVGHGKAG